MQRDRPGVSSFFNFNLNNRIVFRNGGSYGKALLRYYLLAVPQLAASTLLLSLFVWLFHVQSDNGSTLVKILVDGSLFVASFFIQKFWVFREKRIMKFEPPCRGGPGGSVPTKKRDFFPVLPLLFLP